MQPGEPLQPVDRPVGPAAKAWPTRASSESEPGERASRLGPLAVGVEPGGATERDGLPVVAHAELERRAAGRPSRGFGAGAAVAGRIGLQRDDPTTSAAATAAATAVSATTRASGDTGAR